MKQTIIASTLALLIGIAGGWIGRTAFAQPKQDITREAERAEMITAMHRVCMIRAKWAMENPHGTLNAAHGYGPTPESYIRLTGMMVEIPCLQVVEEIKQSAK